LALLVGDRSLSLRSADLANLLTAARAGLGLAILPCIMARGAPRFGQRPDGLGAADPGSYGSCSTAILAVRLPFAQ
jgi:DNA-binding transcriptional LysR family regulator